ETLRNVLGCGHVKTPIPGVLSVVASSRSRMWGGCCWGRPRPPPRGSRRGAVGVAASAAELGAGTRQLVHGSASLAGARGLRIGAHLVADAGRVVTQGTGAERDQIVGVAGSADFEEPEATEGQGGRQVDG